MHGDDHFALVAVQTIMFWLVTKHLFVNVAEQTVSE
jgi:hypothetical protein